jgi:hypothetical protein
MLDIMAEIEMISWMNFAKIPPKKITPIMGLLPVYSNASISLADIVVSSH